MSLSLPYIRQKNAEYVKHAAAKDPVAVFVGATSGLGEYTAYAFAKYTRQPTIYIVGRNAEAGARVISKLKEINASPEAKFTFLQGDLTLVSEADKLADIIKQRESRINLLFLSPGVTSIGGRIETKEGIDTKLAIHYYGRWRLIDNLMPLVLKGNQMEPAVNNTSCNARVVSVLGPGNEGPVKEDDLDLKNNYNLWNCFRHVSEFNSLAVNRFADKYSSVGFLHVHPGVVATNILRGLPWYARTFVSPIMWFAKSPEDAGEQLFYASVAPEFRTGAHLLDASLKSINEKPEKKGYLSKELQDKVWSHTQDIFKQAKEKDNTSSV